MLKNLNGRRVKSMAYVVKKGKESLLRRKDEDALGVIMINPKGVLPDKQIGDLSKSNWGFPKSPTLQQNLPDSRKSSRG